MSHLQIPYIPGMSVLKIFKDIKVNECLFDDFMRYEVEEAQYKPHRRCKLSYNAPDFVPVSQRTKDLSANQQTKSSSMGSSNTGRRLRTHDSTQTALLKAHQSHLKSV
nr:unnamed protein product [Digitaria exilis]